MRVQRLADHRRVPWRNGLGTTMEVAVGPLLVADDESSWSWRVSVATVDQDGPFSSFPNVDRTLVVVEGDGLELQVGSHRFSALPSCPVNFPGDEPTTATLLNGPVRDLNVMVRRTVATTSVYVTDATTLMASSSTGSTGSTGSTSVVFALADATVGPHQLARFDAVVGVEVADGPVPVNGQVVVVDIRPEGSFPVRHT